MKIFTLLLLSYNIFTSININNQSESNQELFTKINAINQDEAGYIWIGTDNGVYKYNGYKFELLRNCNFDGNLNISKLITTPLKTLLFVKNKRSLFTFSNGKCKKLKLKKGLIINDIYKAYNQKIWIATNKGIYYLSNKYNEIIKLSNMLFSNKIINKILVDSSNNILFSNKGKLFIFYKDQDKILNFSCPDKNVKIIHDFKIQNNILYIATDVNIFQFDLKTKTFNPTPLLKHKIRVPSIIINNNVLWATTIGIGLVRVDLKTNEIINYSKSRLNNNAIKEDSLVSLFLSRDNTLFIGGFYQGLSQINLASLKFNFNTIECNEGLPNYSAILDKSSNIWIGSDNKLIKYDLKLNECAEVILKSLNQPFSLYSMSIVDNKIWFSMNEKLFSIDIGTKETIKEYNHKQFIKGILYSKHSDSLYIYSKSKLNVYNLNTQQKNSIKLDINEPLEITDLSLDRKTILLSTNRGLYRLNSNNKIVPVSDNKIFLKNISTISTFNKVSYVAIVDDGIYTLINDNLKLLFNFEISGLPKNIKIDKILKINNILWITSNKGLIRFDDKSNNLHLYEFNDGLYNNMFYKNFTFLGHDDKLYFGGKNGFVHFNPNEIFINESSPPIVLDNLYIQNKKVTQNTLQSSGFLITKPINELDKIELSYKDYIIGFEFAAHGYANPMRNQYAYRLKGFQQDWVYTDAKNRQATYTNLSAGEYTFQVKGSNKDGVWSTEPKELKIIVHPAPWFSPWAYALYTFFILLSIWGFIRFKTIASRKRAIYLEQKVKERTQEVNQQKKMVESLLEHKNEVFANITHEFKTPLALILGPAEQLTKHKELIKHSNELSMIERNAKRLLLMVAQILKLSQAENDKEVIRESQAVQPTLLMLYEAFRPLALNKNIDFQFDNKIDVNIYATAECLEVVVSNLLSNALKYTNEGGKIILYSTHVNKQVTINVSDSGSGIKEQDRAKIFKRFARLDTHKNIAGTGIGLSVVKEITEANDGHVELKSQWGQGSTFSVTFPITEIQAQEEMSEIMVDQLVKNTENELNSTQFIKQTRKLKNQITVLIIEDNLDMQQHIHSVLKHKFNCLFAHRGQKGIGIALKKLPDIIICDVMMPGMDGYQVTRILRHDGRTSHIPIILLTALNTTQSRIKGWRENIDTYMTKPFNSEELNAQIDNILIIRTMLQKQTNQAIRSNSALDSLNLSKQDEKFIDKFKDVIGKYYSNEYFQKADLASKMAISERQLQRKLKALIDQNPMEMLRDYRLEKAAMKLKDGYQVGIVSDECGFSSVSYFGSCFKKKYGITPKAYQTLNKRV